MVDGPVLIARFEEVTNDLLDRTAKFPKHIRFTLSARIEERALDVLEALVEARYTRGKAKAQALAGADAHLARLRVLLRLAHTRQHLDHRAYAHVSLALDECGRMLGGWRAQQVTAMNPASHRPTENEGADPPWPA